MTALDTFDDFAEDMISVASGLRHKIFHGRTGPYLVRFYLHEGLHRRVFLQRLLRADEDPEMHSHPWDGTCLVLRGGYVEERWDPKTSTAYPRVHRPGSVNILFQEAFHRVSRLLDKESWSLVTTGSDSGDWEFLDPGTGIKTPWRTFIEGKGLRIGPESVMPVPASGVCDAQTPGAAR